MPPHKPRLGPHALLRETLGPVLDKLLETLQVATGALAYAFLSKVWAPEVPPVLWLSMAQLVILSIPSLSQVSSSLFHLGLGGVPSGHFFCSQMKKNYDTDVKYM